VPERGAQPAALNPFHREGFQQKVAVVGVPPLAAALHSEPFVGPNQAAVQQMLATFEPAAA
jgi:hypothetical protein